MQVELDEVYGVIVTSFWQTVLGKIVVLVGVVGALFLLYALFKWIKRYRALSTKERALHTLKALKHKVEKSDQDPKKVYLALTDTIKMYAQWRFGIERGLSDYELMAALNSQGQTSSLEESLRRIMSQAQVVKFGLVPAQRTQMKEDIDTVMGFIVATEQALRKRGSLEV